MTPLLWTFLLAGSVFLLFALPMLPALLELHYRRDAKPLLVVREYDGNVAHFAQSFQRFIDEHLANQLPALGDKDNEVFTANQGQSGILLGTGARFLATPDESSGQVVNRLVIGAGDLALPEHILFEGEVYAGKNFQGGRLAAYRAILARSEIRLAEDSMVLRWIHAGGWIRVASNSQLYGRASSAEGLELHEDVHFERLHAPEIRFGQNSASTPLPDHAWQGNTAWEPPSRAEFAGERWFVRGALEIPTRARCSHDIVATGAVTIQEHGWLQSSLKSQQELLLKDNCRVDGAIVAGGALRIGKNSRISGPLVSEGEVVLATGCRIGTPELPTTISARRIRVEPGVVVYGTLWAREGGWVEKAA